MKKIILTISVFILSALIIETGYAWEVPNCIRANAGVRMWFSNIEGDLIQLDRTKIGLGEKHGAH